jgi:hypothetical protein
VSLSPWLGHLRARNGSDAQYGTAGRQEKIDTAGFAEVDGNFALKPGLNCSVFMNMPPFGR